MRRLILTLLALLALGLPAHAATYYMATAGGGGSDSNPGTSGSPWLTLHHAFANMSAGDTLTIADGTYTGTNNAIGDVYQLPPKSTSLWTTIKATNRGQVVFDGQDTYDLFYVYNGGANANCHWVFDGLVWANMSGTSVMCYAASYVKFLNCSAYDAGSGNAANFAFGKWGGTYGLFENCWAYGGGRYKFLLYHAQYTVLRNCVGRMDYTSAGTDPMAVFAMYGASHCYAQNCIAIDSDQNSAYSAGNYQGCFFVPQTDQDANDIHWRNCIGLNVHIGGLYSAKDYSTQNHIYWDNITIWDCRQDYTGNFFNQFRSEYDVATNITFGNNTDAGYTSFLYSYGNTGENQTSLKNSVIYNSDLNYSGEALFNSIDTQDYNCYYGNTNTTGVSGTHNITGTNPTASSILYPVRIESGSALDGTGESGADIGANILTQYGTSGTLYGETGYDTDTGNDLWPYPNEDLIKTSMAAYSDHSVSGARGFCTGTSKDGSSQTLTKYIWEYLGNQIPVDIYDSYEIVPGFVGVGLSGVGVN